jgi:hypothetical protein
MSQTPEQQQDYEDENDDADTAAWVIPVAMLPRSETWSANERENQKNDYENPKHVFLLFGQATAPDVKTSWGSAATVTTIVTGRKLGALNVMPVAPVASAVMVPVPSGLIVTLAVGEFWTETLTAPDGIERVLVIANCSVCPTSKVIPVAMFPLSEFSNKEGARKHERPAEIPEASAGWIPECRYRDQDDAYEDQYRLSAHFRLPFVRLPRPATCSSAD